jgi:hypothetical protein
MFLWSEQVAVAVVMAEAEAVAALPFRAQHSQSLQETPWL